MAKPIAGKHLCAGHAGRDPLQSPRRRNGCQKAVYIAIGTDLTGKKDVLGLWVGATESSKYWLGVLNGLKNRGVSDILLVSVDGLSGFSEAIAVAFPKTEIQRCIIHQIRSSTRYVYYKDVKAFTAMLKPIYKAPTEEAASEALDELERVWGAKYPAESSYDGITGTSLRPCLNIRNRSEG